MGYYKLLPSTTLEFSYGTTCPVIQTVLELKLG